MDLTRNLFMWQSSLVPMVHPAWAGLSSSHTPWIIREAGNSVTSFLQCGLDHPRRILVSASGSSRLSPLKSNLCFHLSPPYIFVDLSWSSLTRRRISSNVSAILTSGNAWIVFLFIFVHIFLLYWLTYTVSCYNQRFMIAVVSLLNLSTLSIGCLAVELAA